MLYERHCDRLNGWACSRLGKVAAEDVMQEFWASVWIKPQQIRCDEQGAARNSMLQVVTFRILKYVHKQSRQLEIADDELVVGQIPFISYTHVQEELDAKEIQQLIDRIMEGLPELARKIYEARCRQNKSVKETARQLGIAESTVRNNLSAILMRLRRELVVQYEIGGDADKFKLLLALIFLLER